MPRQHNSVFYPALNRRGPSFMGLYTPGLGAVLQRPAPPLPYGQTRPVGESARQAGMKLVSAGVRGSPDYVAGGRDYGEDLVSGGIASGPLAISGYGGDLSAYMGGDLSAYLGQLPSVTLPDYMKYGIIGVLGILGWRKTIPRWAALAGIAGTFFLVQPPVSTTGGTAVAGLLPVERAPGGSFAP